MVTDVDVLVIGAGVSGLTTAYAMKQRGAAVEVIEAAPRSGGVIGTRRRNSAVFETGPNSTLDTTPLINELLDGLGIRGERVDAATTAATRFVVRGGKLVPLPGTPGAFLTTGAFSLRAKLALLREPFVAPAAPDAEEESIAAFVRRRLGAELLDYAIDPFVAGVYAGDPERISVSAAFPRLHALEQKYGSLIKGQLLGARERNRSAERPKNRAASFSFRGGMATLTDALARDVGRIETGVQVRRIERGADGAYTVAGARAGEPVLRRTKSVVIAAPAYDAAKLMRELAPEATKGLAGIEYAAVASVTSAYRRADVAHSLGGFGFLVPKKEARRILGTLFMSSMFDGRAPESSVLLTTFIGGKRNAELMRSADGALMALVREELAALLGAANPPLWAEITRWTHAIPQYNLGHALRLRPVEDAERALPGLFFCASYRGGVSVGDCIKSAHATAGAATRFLAGAPRS
jgi:protoporphyrinogen/coproporphyrinogen III oxidase